MPSVVFLAGLTIIKYNMKQKITRRQKDVSRLLREKKMLQRDVLRHSKKPIWEVRNEQ